MNLKKSLQLVVFTLTGVFFSLHLNSQETNSSLGGTLKDGKGAPIEGVTVVLKHEPTGFTSRAVSNSKGYYLINNLQPGGPYKVSMSYVGFATSEKSNVMLSLGFNTLNQQLGETATQLANVTVSSKRGANRAGANVQINQNQIRSIPMLNRSLQDVTKLTPQSNITLSQVPISGTITLLSMGRSITMPLDSVRHLADKPMHRASRAAAQERTLFRWMPSRMYRYILRRMTLRSVISWAVASMR